MKAEIRANHMMKAIILESFFNGKINGKEAAYRLGISPRQFLRLKNRYKSNGELGLLHKNKGKKAWNKTPEHVVRTIHDLLNSRYVHLSFFQAHKAFLRDTSLQISYSTFIQICHNFEKLKRLGFETK